MKNKPRIGLSMRLEIETRRFYLGRDYSEALESFGAIPVHLPLIADRNFIFSAVESLDGILLPGSDTDVDPYRFGEDPHPKIKKTIHEKDETDLLMLEAAEISNLPVLAICFGMQALNVARGGTLYQDLESQFENTIKHEQGAPLERNSHKIKIEEHSRLSRLITTERAGGAKANSAISETFVNSHHHQAVKAVGENLKATAWANDGVIECIEDTREDRFVLGVQWHPELSYKFDRLSKNIFKDFVENCSKNRRK